MKFNWILLPLLLVLPFFAQAQKPCGTPAQKSEWLTKFQRNPQNFLTPEDDTILYIPMTIHLLGNDNGTGYYKFEDLVASLCQLNTDYVQANIQFFIESPLHYLNSSAYNNHNTVLEGAEMMFANDVPNTLNSYFLDNPADNCGYNLPYASIAINKGCAGIGSHTWAHEIGHDFTLPHPFLGWEGKTYQEGDTAPVKVTYDYTYFQDTLILDTLIIDTTFVELVDGSNCLIAADGFCDTPPDYLAYRWFCSSQNDNGFWETDPNGETFKTSGELFMSYAYDQCQSKFSPNQIAAMRSFVLNERPNYLYNQTPLPNLSSEKAQLLSPASGALTDPNYTQLIWNNFGPSAKYHLVVAKAPNMSYILIDTFVTDTSIVLSGLESRKYYWKVQPFNKYSYCTPNSIRGKFQADESIVAIMESEGEQWTIQPTFVKKGQELQIITHQEQPNAKATLLNMAGVVVQQTKLSREINRITLSEKCEPGMYFLMIQSTKGGLFRQKIVIF